MVNYVTPGFATAVYVSSMSVQRIRTTAESHRRIAIIEVMGRDCGMIALGTAYGQPDIILVPESPVDPGPLVDRVIAILDIQKHAVICVSEGIVDMDGDILGSKTRPTTRPGTSSTPGRPRPSSGSWSSGIGDAYFTRQRRNESADAAIFVRKIGHTQRGGRPIKLRSVSTPRNLAARRSSCCWTATTTAWRRSRAATEGSISIAWMPTSSEIAGASSTPGRSRSLLRPEDVQTFAQGVQYFRSMFANALGAEDVESIRSIFDTGNLIHPYDSVNVHIHKRIRRLPPET